MSKKYEKHTIYFWLLTIVLSTASQFLNESFFLNYSDYINQFCLFLILTIGISHGSLDNIKGKKVLNYFRINNQIVFYLSYISVASIVILLWIYYPSITLILFLLIASFHFGKEDIEFFYSKKNVLDIIFFTFKGSIIIFAPLFFNYEQTIKIFDVLMINKEILLFINEQKFLINIFFILSLISNLYFIYKSFDDWLNLVFDTWSILALNYFFSPVIAFSIYFCFLHSVRHSIGLIFSLDQNNFKKGIKLFILKALPLTTLTIIIYMSSLVILSNFYSLDNAIITLIFIGLASLTFPHILLEYILEKNEKKT